MAAHLRHLNDYLEAQRQEKAALLSPVPSKRSKPRLTGPAAA